MMSHRFPGKSLLLLLIAFISGLVALSGCATLGKDECLNADWRTIGYEDGARGYPTSKIGSHRKDCAKHGITPDFERYEQGRLDGLQEYCTPQKGYILGTSGRQYTQVCPPDLEEAFAAGYYQGRIVYDAETELKRQNAEMTKKQNELHSLEKELQGYEAELINDDTGPRRRKKLLEEIKMLTEQRLFILGKIKEQEALIETSQLNLKKITAKNPY
jgi:hypothetical protein